MAQPMVVWDPQMLRYDLGGSHPLHPLRLELTWALAGALGVLDGVPLTAPAAATDDELAELHTRDYIAAVRRSSGPEPADWHAGYGIGTADNPAFPGMHEASALIAGGSIAAARAIADGTVHRAVNIAGGLHHAMADRASGFCVYNDPALAIKALLAGGVERVAYVDVDVHHGDGVQAAFYDDPRVLTVSIHETPLALWPGTGFPTECGRGAAAGTAVNVPVPAGAGDAAWLRAFHAVIPSVVTAFRPQVLVTQHGADSHRDDPLADLNLTVDGQVAAARALRELAGSAAGGRWLALGGGGYSLVTVVPRTWTHLLALVLDRDVDPATPIPDRWIAAAAAARPSIVPPRTMTDGTGAPPPFDRWDGHTDGPIDRSIAAVRRAVFPAFGLDPFDPRD
jgi:acetoin utilization protein AcuC